MEHRNIEYTLVRSIDGGWKYSFEVPGKRPMSGDIVGSRDYALRMVLKAIDRALKSLPQTIASASTTS